MVVEEEGITPGRHYALTPKGEQLYIVLVALWQWGENNCQTAVDLGHVMVDTKTSQPLPQLQLLSRDGRVLGPGDFRMMDR